MPSATTVRVAHLLVKHTDSRNPVSRRTGQAVALDPAAAFEELRFYQSQIVQESGVGDTQGLCFPDGNVFAKYAAERSDCSSYSRQGDLGHFGPGAMQQPFEEGSFALQVGQMSDIVSTDSGYHLIYRIE